MLTILEIFSDIWKIITNMVKAVTGWVAENPKAAGLIALMVISNFATMYFTHKWTKEEVIESYTEIIKVKDAKISQYEQDVEQREAKVKQVEADSKVAADNAAAIIKAKDAEYALARTDYQRKLQAEIEKRKGETVIVTDPTTQSPINVTIDNGEVICSRFHDAFLDSINSLISTANNPISVVPAVLPVSTKNATPTVSDAPKGSVDSPQSVKGSTSQ